MGPARRPDAHVGPRRPYEMGEKGELESEGSPSVRPFQKVVWTNLVRTRLRFAHFAHFKRLSGPIQFSHFLVMKSNFFQFSFPSNHFFPIFLSSNHFFPIFFSIDHFFSNFFSINHFFPIFFSIKSIEIILWSHLFTPKLKALSLFLFGKFVTLFSRFGRWERIKYSSFHIFVGDDEEMTIVVHWGGDVSVWLKVVSVCIGCCFGGIEYCYTRVKGKGRTTLCQFWVLVLYWPLVVFPLLVFAASFDPFYVGVDGGRGADGVCDCIGERQQRQQQQQQQQQQQRQQQQQQQQQRLPFSINRIIFFPIIIWTLEAIEVRSSTSFTQIDLTHTKKLEKKLEKN